MSELKNKISELFTSPFLLAKAAKENPSESLKQATETVNDVIEGMVDGVTKGLKIFLADQKTEGDASEVPAEKAAPASKAASKPRASRASKKK